MEISIETEVAAPLIEVWKAWITPEDITHWNFAIEEWCCPSADIDLRVGGTFNYRMEAKDGSFGFDFVGEFTQVSPFKSIHYKLGDDRAVKVEFMESAGGTRVVETFDAENENSAEQQRQGWQGILINFKKHVEKKSGNQHD